MGLAYIECDQRGIESWEFKGERAIEGDYVEEDG